MMGSLGGSVVGHLTFDFSSSHVLWGLSTGASRHLEASWIGKQEHCDGADDEGVIRMDVVSREV